MAITLKFERVKHKLFLAMSATMITACATQASAQQFSGPYVAIEAAHEDYEAVDGESLALTAGWDVEVAPAWVAGASVRATVDGVADTRIQAVGMNTATTETSLEDQWSVNARVGRVFGDRVLVFGQLGYEQFHYNAVRELRAPVCVPPNGCLISRLDGSFDEEMVTYGAGIEWAATDNWRLRGTYTFGDGDAFEQKRFALTAAFQF